VFTKFLELGSAQKVVRFFVRNHLKVPYIGVPLTAAYQGGVWRKELLDGWLKQTKMEDVNLPTFLKHTTYDDFWKKLSAEAHADRVDAPGVFIGGWYDIFIQGTINSLSRSTVAAAQTPEANASCSLRRRPTANSMSRWSIAISPRRRSTSRRR
jgi:hypothetical protein